MSEQQTTHRQSDREVRARELLLTHLDAEQRRTYCEGGYIEEQVNGAWYCVHRGHDSIIHDLTGKGGTHIARLCSHAALPLGTCRPCPCGNPACTAETVMRAADDFPVDDIVLTHLMLMRAVPTGARAAVSVLMGARAPCGLIEGVPHVSPAQRLGQAAHAAAEAVTHYADALPVQPPRDGYYVTRGLCFGFRRRRGT